MRKKAPKTIEYGPAHSSHGYAHVRWVENVSDGLRRVGFADAVSRALGYHSINHKGWFTREDGDGGDVCRGIVYRLPARNGKQQFVYGYDDSNNENAALLCFDDPTDNEHEAALAADRFAEIFAAHERDYDRAWQAGRRFEYLEEEIKTMRKGALAIGEEMRRVGLTTDTPTLYIPLRDKIISLYLQIQKARRERAELLDTYGDVEGFKDA